MCIYIKGMKMPDKCGHCRFATAFECEVTKNFITTFNVRQQDCPLVPVIPHGRLIDASEEIQVQMYDDQHEDFYQVKMTIDDLLSQSWIDAKAPTIIPAEEEQ